MLLIVHTCVYVYMCECVAECRQVSIGYRVTGHLHGGGELDFGLLCRLSDSLQCHVVSGDVQSLLWCGWFIEREGGGRRRRNKGWE